MSRMGLALLLYVALYLGVAFVLRSWIVWQKTGINPVVIGTGDDVHGCVGRWMRLTITAIAVVVTVFALAPTLYTWLGPFARLEGPAARAAGAVLLVASFLWTVLAQRQMGVSWRIGVDGTERTALVERGLFRVSRNPIFLGMIATLAGLFLVLPSTATLVIMVVGIVVIELQVRLEEDHLVRIHGDAYTDYRRRVSRWLGWPSAHQPRPGATMREES